MPTTVGQLIGPVAPALAWAGLAAISVPILIHLLTRLRRHPLPWGAMRFLLEAFRRHRTRLRFEQYLLLILRCLILAVLGLALSGPGLQGCAGEQGWAGSGRLICIVLDDSLTSQAGAMDGRRRFDQLRDTAMAIIEAASSIDRVAVWRAAWPSETLVFPSELNHTEALQAVSGLEPRYSRSDLQSVLRQVRGLAHEESVSADRTFVVLLTDWANDALDFTQNPTVDTGIRGSGYRFFAARPVLSVDNLLLEAIEPRRRIVLAEADGSAVVSFDLKLRRHAIDPIKMATKVELTPVGRHGKPVSPGPQRLVEWTAGQTVATIGIDVAVSDWDRTHRSSAGGGVLGIRADLMPPSTSDKIEADNRRWVTVELRDELRVGIVDRFEIKAPRDSLRLLPRQWLSAALAPSRLGLGGDGPVELVDLEASSLSEPLLRGLDAAMVLRPDRLTDSGWQSLGRFAERGGLVWLFMPVKAGPAVWAKSLREHLAIGWQLALEVDAAKPPRDQGWSLASGPTAPAVPEPLNLLAVDWSSLLRPVRVTRRFGLAKPNDATGSDGVWLSTDDGEPLLVAASVGQGQVMLLATALEPEWTNLPTKPFFVPLLHESLRSAVGGSKPEDQPGHVLCGDQPVLGLKWQGAQSLRIGQTRVALRQTDDGLQLTSPLERPGLYEAQPNVGGRLSVNIDPQASDTRGLDESAVSQWLSGLGNWQWIDLQDPVQALANDPQHLSLGWPLLWAVLALVMIETSLARWFSHAQAGSRRGRTVASRLTMRPAG